MQFRKNNFSTRKPSGGFSGGSAGASSSARPKKNPKNKYKPLVKYEDSGEGVYVQTKTRAERPAAPVQAASTFKSYRDGGRNENVGYREEPRYSSRSNRGGRDFGGRRGGNGGAGRSRIKGTTIRLDQLINRVNKDESTAVEVIEIKHKFIDFGFDPRLQKNVDARNYKLPTPIQDQSIPVGLSGRDVIGIANTGTGKTAAFLLPLINKMLHDRNEKAIILAPTRELAQQILDELIEFSRGLNLQAVLAIGGASINAQARAIRMPFNFLIGTPGRVIDLFERRLLHLDRFQNVVLDEADRMVDMGFINDMKLILGKVAKNRQSYFFTATMENKVEDLIRQFLNSPVKISVKVRDTAKNIEQDIVRVPSDVAGKIAKLAELLRTPEFSKTIVFGRTKHGVEKISKALYNFGIRSDSIHGDKTQAYRQKALNRFKSGEVDVLLATDVAARGLDIKEVSHVINFDLPSNYDDYVHRIGRTGRADKKGMAITFVSDRD